MEESTQVDASNNDSERSTSLDNAEDDPDVLNDTEFIQSATIEEIEAWKETNDAMKKKEVSGRYGNRIRGLSSKSISFLLDKSKMSISGEEDESFE
eukprot:11239093-Ditylum_brightwellii.AAC.1